MNFNFFKVATLFTCIIFCAKLNAQQIVTTSHQSKTAISLNGDWKFKLITSNSIGKDSTFFEENFDVQQWANISTPSNWELKGFAEPMYGKVAVSGNGLYKKWFNVPANWQNMPTYICFDGVLFGYQFWINGQYVAEFASAFNRKVFDISKFIQSGKNNSIAVRVLKQPKGWEFDIFDCWSLSGIYRDVTVFALPQTHFADVIVSTKLKDSNTTLLQSRIVISEQEKLSADKPIAIKAKLIDATGKLIKHWDITSNASFNYNTSTVENTIPISNLQLWTAETPYLYTIEYSIVQGNKTINQYKQTIGVRELAWQNGILQLNGKPVKLHGVNHHDLSPINGRAVTNAEILQDLLLMQKANINYIRTSHYPPHPRLLELCDSLGFYVMDEVPFGWGEDYLSDTNYLPNLLNRVEATVARDKNHPSVIVWSVGNENPLTKMAYQVGKHVKLLDTTRPICYPQVGSYFMAHQSLVLQDSIDIIAPHYLRNKDLKGISNKFFKPIIVTEYAHAFGLDFDRVQEQWQIMYDAPKIAGGSVWHFFDQGLLQKATQKVDVTKNTVYAWIDSLNFYNTGDVNGVDGLVYANRIPQVDYWQVKKVYSPVQILQDTAMYNAAKKTISFTIQNRYDFTNLNNLQCYWQLFADTTILLQGKQLFPCNPRNSMVANIVAAIPTTQQAQHYMLKLIFSNKQNNQVYSKVLVLQANQSSKNLLQLSVAKTTEPQLQNNSIKQNNYSLMLQPTGWVSINNQNNQPVITQAVFARVNRKPTLSMRGKKMSTYYLQNQQQKIQYFTNKALQMQYSFISADSTVPSIAAQINYQFSDSGYIQVQYLLKPDTTNANQALETGVSFLLPSSITEFRWIGLGPYAGYPGKNMLNDFGFYHLTSNDIYFPGNRQNVSCAIFSDKNGNGFALFANKADIAVEHTPQGLLVSHNAIVSGRYNKGTQPELQFSYKQLQQISGSFIILPLSQSWPLALQKIFGNPKKQVKAFAPFYYSYDQ